jgi:type II secretory pathway pseudopilin PulG
MFWIIVLAVVIVIVVFSVIGSRKAREREKAEAAAAAEKRKEEQERLIKELEPQAAAGDAVAAKRLTMIKEKINEPIVYDSTYSHYGIIYYRAQDLPTVYRTAGNILLDAIARHGGWDDFSIEKEVDNTNKPKEGNMCCYFTAVTGESCSVDWWYNTTNITGACTRPNPNGGVISCHAGYNSISASVSLKMQPETVAAIVEEFAREITGYIKSNGGYQVYRAVSEFYEPKGRRRNEIWNS